MVYTPHSDLRLPLYIWICGKSWTVCVCVFRLHVPCCCTSLFLCGVVICFHIPQLVYIVCSSCLCSTPTHKFRDISTTTIEWHAALTTTTAMAYGSRSCFVSGRRLDGACVREGGLIEVGAGRKRHDAHGNSLERVENLFYSPQTKNWLVRFERIFA